jgi:hypothetical protein
MISNSTSQAGTEREGEEAAGPAGHAHEPCTLHPKPDSQARIVDFWRVSRLRIESVDLVQVVDENINKNIFIDNLLVRIH